MTPDMVIDNEKPRIWLVADQLLFLARESRRLLFLNCDAAD
ncbi:hypothetical protein CPter291_2615 [Collimonas pratensis]|uniref:Uncharacterized protein n=1 Tax=Collimonas pratensis TaxID=279113 RepID=A0ABM5Z778_9BURK|nr:hypothetical protein CPter291_2615 [Collimonas pratensis]